MSTYGVTSTGFQQKRLADIAASLKSRLESVTDANGNTISIDLEDSSLVSQIVMLTAEAIAETWEMGSAVATQFDPRYNTGAFQSGVVQLNGIFRRASVPTQLAVTFGGTSGTVITKGKLVATSDNEHTFTVDADYTIGGGGTVTGYVTSTEKTPVVVANSASMNIQSPIPGWTTVVCNTTSVAGISEETDEELRTRQQISTQLTAQRESEAILNAVSNVDGVTLAQIYENPTNTVDANGLPPGSICVLVLGGEDQDITDAIYNKMSCMTQTSGNVSNVYGLVTVSFRRADEVPIAVAVTAAAKSGYTLPTDYVTQVKNAITTWASSDDSYRPGESVYASDIYGVLSVLDTMTFSALTVAQQATVAATGWARIDNSALLSAKTITIGSKTYTFKLTPTTANDVKIGTSNAATALNLFYAVNDTGAPYEGTNYGTGTTANAEVSATVNGSTVTFTAKTAGTGGNSVGLSTNASSGSTYYIVVSGSTLTGGTNTTSPAASVPIIWKQIAMFNAAHITVTGP